MTIVVTIIIHHSAEEPQSEAVSTLVLHTALVRYTAKNKRITGATNKGISLGIANALVVTWLLSNLCISKARATMHASNDDREVDKLGCAETFKNLCGLGGT